MDTKGWVCAATSLQDCLLTRKMIYISVDDNHVGCDIKYDCVHPFSVNGRQAC